MRVGLCTNSISVVHKGVIRVIATAKVHIVLGKRQQWKDKEM